MQFDKRFLGILGEMRDQAYVTTVVSFPFGEQLCRITLFGSQQLLWYLFYDLCQTIEGQVGKQRVIDGTGREVELGVIHFSRNTEIQGILLGLNRNEQVMDRCPVRTHTGRKEPHVDERLRCKAGSGRREG